MSQNDRPLTNGSQPQSNGTNHVANGTNPLAHNQSSSSRRSSFQPFPPLSPSQSSDSQGLPVRHPRPLTAAELHLEVEKEQEAIVNRLTRELSLLRAHSASVASTASSSTTAPGSTSFALDPHDPLAAQSSLPLPVDPSHPGGARPHRSGSNASASGGATFARALSVGAGAAPSLPRYDEIALHRAELEEAKRENERLRQRLMELEVQLRERRIRDDAGTTERDHTT